MRTRALPLAFLTLLWGCGDDSPGGQAVLDAGTNADAAVETGVEGEEAPALVGCESDINSTQLGDVALGSDGLSEPLAFEIPECAHSFMLMIEGPEDVSFILERLTAPNGEDWITSEIEEPLDPLSALFIGPFPGQFLSPVRMVQGEGVGTALVANSPLVPFQCGRFEAVLKGAYLTASNVGTAELTAYEGTVAVEVLWKGRDTAAAGGTLDVTVHLSGAGDLSAANARESEFLQDALDALGGIYAQANVAIGEVRYVDIAESFRTVESIQGLGNELSSMFRLGGDNPPGMNFFLVDRFDIPGLPGGAIGGIAGGIPGPGRRPGTVRSGVAVSVAAAEGDPNTLAHIMAHEGGHYLGLFHTVEFFGAEDPLDDTPGGQASNTNLMFPAVGGGTELTAQQGRVMHNHPEVAP